MRRLVKWWPAAVAAGLMMAGPVQAGNPAGEDAPESGRRGDRWSRSRPGRPDRRPADTPDLTEDEAVAAGIPAMFREAFPARAAKFDALARSRPALYRRAVVHLHRMARELDDLKRHDHEFFVRRWTSIKLHVEIDELADQRRLAKTDAERKTVDRQLAVKLGESFDAREDEQRLRIKHLEEEIAEVKSRLERRKKLRAQMIERRMNELREDEPLEF